MNRVRGDGGKFFKGNKSPNQKLGDFKIQGQNGSKRRVHQLRITRKRKKMAKKMKEGTVIAISLERLGIFSSVRLYFTYLGIIIKVVLKSLHHLIIFPKSAANSPRSAQINIILAYK